MPPRDGISSQHTFLKATPPIFAPSSPRYTPYSLYVVLPSATHHFPRDLQDFPDVAKRFRPLDLSPAARQPVTAEDSCHTTGDLAFFVLLQFQLPSSPES
jgi:hypothetical protein